jgi:hypothetical protein
MSSFLILFGMLRLIYCTCLALIGWFDLSSLPHACAGMLDVRRMVGELIVSDRWVRSLALIPVCLLIRL